MFSNILGLEISKQKKMFLNALIVILSTIIFVAIRQWMSRQDLREDFAGWILILLLGGIPLLAAIFGISSAAGIRKEPERSAEEPLPISPFARSIGSYLVSLFLMISIGLPLLILGKSVGSLLVFESYGIELQILIVVGGVLYFHLLVFVLGYWFKEIFLSIALAALVLFAHYELLQQWNQMVWHDYALDLKTMMWATLVTDSVFSFVGIFAALAVIAKRIQTGVRIHPMRALMICMLISFGLLVSFGLTAYTMHQATTRLIPSFGWWLRSQDETVLGKDFLAQTLTGTTIRLDKDGNRQVILRNSDYENQSAHSILNKDGSVWAVKKASEKSIDQYILLYAPAGQAVREISYFKSGVVEPDYFYMRGEEVVLRGWGKGSINSTFFSKIPFSNNIPDWKPTPVDYIVKEMATVLSQEGIYAVLSKDRRILIQTLTDGKTKEWHLPGLGQGFSSYIPEFVTLAVGAGEKSAFALPIQSNGSFQIMLCKPDRTVLPVWNIPCKTDGADRNGFCKIRWKSVDGGSAWLLPENDYWGPYRTMFFLGADGSVYPPLDIRNVYKQINMEMEKKDDLAINSFDVRRAFGSKLWVLLKGIPVELDLRSGKVTGHSENLVAGDESRAMISPLSTQEGIYYIAHGRIGLYSWDGTVHDLGPASVK